VNDVQTSKRADDDEIDLRELVLKLWAAKLTIALSTAFVTVAAISYALFSTPIYQSQASVQIRHENRSSMPSQLGSLAALAGISVGARDENREFAMTALTSRTVIQKMIDDENLLPILYANEWDANKKRWTTPRPPTSWKAYEVFVNSVLKITDDKKSGIVRIAVEWKDPVLATAWVDSLILRVNTFVNEATIRESERNLKFLDQQAKSTSVLELQKTIFAMMEAEIKRLMVARNPDTAPLRVLDPAVVSERHIRPKRALIIILGFIAGVMLGATIVLVRSALTT
jgi:uncharacterized protein involved in exopolysaccharide biosynthesis